MSFIFIKKYWTTSKRTIMTLIKNGVIAGGVRGKKLLPH